MKTICTLFTAAALSGLLALPAGAQVYDDYGYGANDGYWDYGLYYEPGTDDYDWEYNYREGYDAGLYDEGVYGYGGYDTGLYEDDYLYDDYGYYDADYDLYTDEGWYDDWYDSDYWY